VSVVGVAIAIPEPHRAKLSAARHAAGDPMAAVIPPHVTLLPPTVIPGTDLDAFIDHLSSVADSHPAFTMRLAGTGSFRPVSPVVFVQVSEGISSCERLERAIRSGPVERRLEFDYHPHVTIAHHVEDEALDATARSTADFVAEFPVVGFDLFEQGNDDVWRRLRTFSLEGAGRDRS
jgi:2'-5' RNA ligase